MTVYGLHASHEQTHPTELLAAVIRAEQAGFDAAMCSDHFSPWSERQGQSAFAWSWLGAALQATSLPFGVVNAPGQRYHPAIIAQAIGTLAAMYPGRFWAALGTGEASNEHITGDGWPRKEQRSARLRESIDVIRALLAGEEVSHDGLVRVDRARVWTRPQQPRLTVSRLVRLGG
jgi:G6PDH family F420-dependent oxidoreductase